MGTDTFAEMSLLAEEHLRQGPDSLEPIDVGASVSWFRHGRHDPTTQLLRSRAGGPGELRRASHTPAGPGTLRLRWSGNVRVPVSGAEPIGLDAEAWGPGADWLLRRVVAMVGANDPGNGHLLGAPDAVVATGASRNRGLRLGATGDLYHSLVPTVIEQRITSGEAKRQWWRVCTELGTPAPGPFEGLLLPPSPAVLVRQPSWWFHPLGLERKRARAVIEVARHAHKMWSWADAGPPHARSKLRLIPGVGPWTIGSSLGPALGDPDALAVGDYHLKNVVSWALRGEPRGTDERMLELLEPYRGDRGRVARLLKMTSGAAPKFGPRQRILPMHRW